MSVTTNDDEFLWVEKFRPNNVDECILPPRIKDLAKNIVESNEATNLIFHGTGGVGKTALAVAIAKEIGCDYLVINCSNENGIDTIRNKLTQFASTVSFNGKPKIAILDEADGLTPDAQRSLRNFIEEYSKNCRFIFTCNFKNKLIAPLHSRLPTVDFTLTKDEKQKIVVQFFKRTCEVLNIEGVTYDKATIANIVEKNFPDFRSILGTLQQYNIQSGGVINSDVLSLDKTVEISELISSLKDKDFKKMRSWVVTNISNDATIIYRRLYDVLNDVCVPQSIPNMILIIADYSYKSAFVVDQEINLVACLTEIMANGEWK